MQNLESLTAANITPKFEKQQNKVRKSRKVIIAAGLGKRYAVTDQEGYWGSVYRNG